MTLMGSIEVLYGVIVLELYDNIILHIVLLFSKRGSFNQLFFVKKINLSAVLAGETARTLMCQVSWNIIARMISYADDKTLSYDTRYIIGSKFNYKNSVFSVVCVPYIKSILCVPNAASGK